MSPTDNTTRAQRHTRLRQRAEVLARMRRHLDALGLTEVETPILSAAANTDRNIESFRTTYSEGFGDCYELGRVFRDGEAGRRHNPEFTMLEWYRTGLDHHALMGEIEALVHDALAPIRSIPRPIPRITYAELFQSTLGIDPHRATIESLQTPLAEYRIRPEGLTRDDWLDLLLTHRIIPTWQDDEALFIHDFPATQAALSRIRTDGDIALAERFELYLGQNEIANGYFELTDPQEQRARFEADNAARIARGGHALPIDETLLAALHTLPTCAGVALGVERLLMWALGCADVADVLAFAFENA